MSDALVVRQLKQQDYHVTWEAMKRFTDQRDSDTLDELWCCEHPPVFTQGLAGKAEHILNPHDIPVVQTDRGGQVTYHGPGQLMLYIMFDLKRLGLGPRGLVCGLEQMIINCLSTYGIEAKGSRDAPGVYVGEAKICSIGLRVRRGCSFHGLAFNVSMDTTPFQWINPCGYKGLAITQIAEYTSTDIRDVQANVISCLSQQFGFNACQFESTLPKDT